MGKLKKVLINNPHCMRHMKSCHCENSGPPIVFSKKKIKLCILILGIFLRSFLILENWKGHQEEKVGNLILMVQLILKLVVPWEDRITFAWS